MLEDAIAAGTLTLQNSETRPAQSAMRDPEVQQCLREFDLLRQVCADTGEQGSYGKPFENCPICGHHDCFVIYNSDDNIESFYCYGTNGNVGGTAIDYLMHTQNLNATEATKYLVHVLCRRPTKTATPHKRKPLDPYALPVDLKMGPDDVNDKELGRLFAKLYKDRLRYVPKEKCYRFFNGKCWEKDYDNQQARGMCKQFIDALLEHQSHIENDDTRRAFIKKVGQYLTANRRDHLIKDAMSELLADISNFDKDCNLFNVLNCTIDLSSGERYEHRASDMLTKCAPVYFNGDARCELWEKVLYDAQFGDEDTVRFLQKVIGKSLIGDTSIEKMFIIGFEWRSSKGVTIGAIEKMMGTNESGYACNVQGDAFEKPKRGSSSGPRGNIAMMRGKRLVVAHEPPEGMPLDSALLKQLTGNDLITARDMYEKNLTFAPTATLLLVTNHMPVVNDRAMINSRLTIIPFERHLAENEQDKRLKQELSKPENLSAILNWCLAGLCMYEAEGLEPSKRVQEATLDAIMTSNWTRRFVDECLIRDPTGRIKLSDAYELMQDWGNSQDGFTDPGRRQFQDELELCRVPIKRRARVDGIDQRNVLMGYRPIQMQTGGEAM